MQTMQQQRARYALQQVRSAKDLLHIDKDEYRRYAAGLPAMIHMNGLGQAVTFYKSKGGTHLPLYDLLAGWLTRPGQPYHHAADLMEAICDGDMHQYRIAQAEAQALMSWVVKFAKAYMITEPRP